VAQAMLEAGHGFDAAAECVTKKDLADIGFGIEKKVDFIAQSYVGSVEDIPFIERDIILRAKKAGKPVITATQMLFTMTEHSQPTRAEVTDVAFAILLGTDAVMLSDETAKGAYPVQAVAMMERIVSRAERSAAVHHVNPLVGSAR
jgi:pyruvate kinase